MEDELLAIAARAEEGAPALSSQAEFDVFKAQFMGPKGALTLISKGIGKIPKEDRPKMGQLINQAKMRIEVALSKAKEAIDAQELAKKLGPAIDPTLPSPDRSKGGVHPLTQVRRLLNDIFRKVGFTIAEGPEIDTEWYCFDALNTPEDHPARDEQDTLFFPKSTVFGNISQKSDERYLLRTHTSTVQIRTMLKEELPLRVVAPGRCFRRDTVDATHSANFHQIEGLYIDRDVTVSDLKALLDYFVMELFGKDVETRLRPSFFPFTEPSFELDVKSSNVGKLSNQWIELFGCGMVDPEVLGAVDIDSGAWTGYAFGMGIERIAMLVYGIDDIRHFYQNDRRFLEQFA